MSVRELLKPGMLIGGRYLTTRILGTGGMGAVYEATDTRLSSRVALKLMTNSDERAPVAFEQEARLLASLNHPSLPRVTDYFTDERGQFLVMDFIEGQDFEQVRHEQGGRLNFQEVYKWTIDLLDILTYLHGHQPPIIHRDIKPANIKLTPSGAIYLLDFGLAKSATTTIQERSLFAYTAQYAPPEQILGVGTDPRADIFSLAATVYCFLTGAPPIDAIQRNQALAQRQPEQLQSLTALVPSVPESFSEAIQRALALDVNQRPTSANEMRELLVGFSAQPATQVALTADTEVTVPAVKAPTVAAPLARRPIWFDPAERAAELVRLVEGFTEAITTERVREAMGRESISRIRLQEQQIRSRLSERFNLVVMGDFKRGKSTLVNALLGQELAPSNVTPETVTINRFTYGSELKIIASIGNGSRMQLTPEDLRAERLEPLMRQLNHAIQYVTIEAPVSWLNGVMLVDMPGTGDLDWRFDSQVQSYLPQADAIIYVISARAPLSASELAFLRRAVVPQEFPKLLFVVNQIDAIRNEADVERVIDLVRSRVDQVFPGATVYGLSGLDELNRRLGRNPPQRRRSEDLGARFATFRRELSESLLLNRELTRTARAVHQTQSLIDMVAEQASRLRGAMDSDRQQLQQSIAQCEDSNSALRLIVQEHRNRTRQSIVALSAQTKRWMDHFIARIQANIVTPLHEYRYADVQRYLTFYLQDVIGQALAACIDAHQSEIATILDQTHTTLSTAVNDKTNMTEAPGLRTSQPVARMTSNQATWNDVDTIRYIASFAQQYIFGAVGQMALAVIFNAVDKKANDTVQLKAYQEQLRKALPALHESLQNEVDILYQRLADEVDNQINNAYEADIASALDTLRQAESLQQAGTQRIQEAQQVCERLIADAQTMRAQLDEFQRTLWRDDLA